MRSIPILIVFLLCFAASGGETRAEEVTIEHQGLDVVGNLETAPGKSLRSDGVVLIVHDTLSHHRAELVLALQDILRSEGINSLAITLSLGLNERRGMYDCSIEQDHRHEDAVEEIGRWVEWLKEKGANAITLVGHGRAANQSALYAINKDDKAIRRIAMLAPLMQSYEKAEADYQAQFGRPLRDTLAQAEELVANEEGATLLEDVGFLLCPSARVTASAFVNYYNANPNFLTTNLLQTLKLPVLVLVAELDPSGPETLAALQGMADKKNISFETITGADHDFRDLAADEAAKHIKEFHSQRPQG